MKTKYYFMLWALILMACSEDDLKEVTEENEGDTIENNNPATITLADFSASVDENPAIGSILGIIDGTTSEGTITYTMVSQSLAGAMALDTNSGELSVADSALFDFETNTSFTAEVAGTNEEISATANVTITVLDLVEIPTVQERLEEGETPFEIYKSDNALLDELYGKSYAGGLIFYFDKATGHGKVAAPDDQSASTTWGCNTVNLGYNVQPPGFPFSVFECVAESQSIGNGQSNTDDILNYCSGGSAAKICAELTIDKYDDWYLPTRNELTELVTKLPQESGRGYWSSSQRCRDTGGSAAFAVEVSGSSLAILKSNSKRVRAIRDFEEPAAGSRANQ